MRHGFLIAADLEDASGLDQTALVKGVEGIRGWYRDLWETRQGALFSPFIDGALIALPLYELKDHKDVYRELIESCEKWIRSVAEIDPALSLRVAIHQGNFFPVLEKLPSQVIVGPHALHCSRLVRLASGGQVIISEEYRDYWEESDKGSYDKFVADKRLHPSGDRPVLFWQKPNTPSRIRYVVPSKKEHVRTSAEKRAALSIRTARRLMAELQADLAVYLQSELDEADPKLFNLENSGGEPDPKLYGRISIFRLDPEKSNQLVCWLRLDRDHNEDSEGESEELDSMKTTDWMDLEFPSATVYSTNPPKGPVGHAFAEKILKIQIGLPDWTKSPKARKDYRDSMKKWGFTPAMTDRMLHHSRALLAIPFSESDLENTDSANKPTSAAGTDRPMGVICVDWDDPLDFIDGDEVFEEFISDFSVYRFSLFAACAMRDGS
jgi:hypothetical protein